MIVELVSMGLGVLIISRTRKTKPKKVAAPPPAAVPVPYEQLQSLDKAAILLMSLAPEVSAQLFKELGPNQVQSVTMSISRLPPIPHAFRDRAAQEFVDAARAVIGAGDSPRGADPVRTVAEMARESPGLVARLLVATWIR